MLQLVYIMVGVLGYVAFYEEPFRGNILVFLPTSFSSTLTKLGFVFTVVISLPICLFPCRTSLHSLLFRKGTGSLLNEPSATAVYMSDHDFRLLTVVLIVTTIGISVIVPRIEVVLGIIGSTIGAIICFILPGMIFTKITTRNTTERIMARSVTYLGFFILIACSWSTIHQVQLFGNPVIVDQNAKLNDLPLSISVKQAVPNVVQVALDSKPSAITPDSKVKEKPPEKDKAEKPLVKPIVPQAPSRVVPMALDPAKVKKQEEILQRLENHQKEQKKLLEQQKQLLAEMKKHEKEVHNVEVKKEPETVEHKAMLPEKPKDVKDEHSAVIPEQPVEPVKNVVPAAKVEERKDDVLKDDPQPAPKKPAEIAANVQPKSPAVAEQPRPAQVIQESKKEPVLPGESVPVLRKLEPLVVNGQDQPRVVKETRSLKNTFDSKDVKPADDVKLPKRDTLAVDGNIIS